MQASASRVTPVWRSNVEVKLDLLRALPVSCRHTRRHLLSSEDCMSLFTQTTLRLFQKELILGIARPPRYIGCSEISPLTTTLEQWEPVHIKLLTSFCRCLIFSKGGFGMTCTTWVSLDRARLLTKNILPKTVIFLNDYLLRSASISSIFSSKFSSMSTGLAAR